jgi:methyl halide transferase
MAGPSVEFWQQRFESGRMPWDRLTVSPQLRTWLDQGVISASDLKLSAVLVPGCGSGYELAELASRGFEVIGLDYAPAAIERARVACDRLPAHQRSRVSLIEADVLNWKPTQTIAAIYEQTCLCALHPDDWFEYAQQLWRWLEPEGLLLALFAQTLEPGAAQGLIQGPPYHCDIHAVRALFPDRLWRWPKPPYQAVTHPMGLFELAIVLQRRS